MEELYEIVKRAREYYDDKPVDWFSIIAMDGDVTLRISCDEFKKHPELMKDVKMIEKSQGISYQKEIEKTIVESFEHIPQGEDIFSNVWNNICELDAEWYLPDSIKWLMFDYWYYLLDRMHRREVSGWTGEQLQTLKRIKEAIHYVE